MGLHHVTSPSFLTDADFANVRPIFEDAIVIVIGVGGG